MRAQNAREELAHRIIYYLVALNNLKVSETSEMQKENIHAFTSTKRPNSDAPDTLKFYSVIIFKGYALEELL